MGLGTDMAGTESCFRGAVREGGRDGGSERASE